MATKPSRISGCGSMVTTGAITLGVIILVRAMSGAPSTTPAPSRPAAPIESVSAQEILAAFDANELAAKRRFSGAVEVEGKVATITSVLGSPALQLEGRTEFETITAVFGSEANDPLAAMAKGTTIRARCETVSDVITPQLGDCTLLSQSTDAP